MSRSARWTIAPLALVVVMLLASVIIPAGEASRILRLLRETSEVVEPARLDEARLEFGLAMEAGALQRYALSGDSAQLGRYRKMVGTDQRVLADLDALARRLGPDATTRTATVRRRIDQWRGLNGELAEGRLSPTESAVALGAQEDEYDAALDGMTGLASYLARQSAVRRDDVRVSERASLIANASLVLVALAAVLTVAALTQRERRLTVELERALRSRSHLMRGFSHDVKNPLGAADGYAALLADAVFGALNTEQRASVERMRRSIREALVLIDDLHELARAETGHVPMSIAAVDVAGLVRTTAEDYRAAASARGLSLHVDVAPGLTTIETDGTRVRQIIGNLMSNAIKYTDTGSVTIRARRTAPLSGDVVAWVAIEVIDTGCGIPRDKQNLVFDEFSRPANADRPGAGLGLAISQRLAQALGGRIVIESEVGRGSTFTLCLPGAWRGRSASLDGLEDVGGEHRADVIAGSGSSPSRIADRARV